MKRVAQLCTVGGVIALILIWSGMLTVTASDSGADVQTNSSAIDGLLSQVEGAVGGASAHVTDADGDGLSTDFESEINTSDQHKDLFIHVYVGEGYRKLSEVEIRRLQAFWADMPVENPDGTTGIRIHVVNQTRLTWTPTVDSADVRERDAGGELEDLVKSNHDRGNWACRSHVVVLAEFTNPRQAAGYGEAPGDFVAFQGTLGESRMYGISHELMHNIVGEFPEDEQPGVAADGYHTTTGVLSHSAENKHLSEPTADLLSEQGFSGGC